MTKSSNNPRQKMRAACRKFLKSRKQSTWQKWGDKEDIREWYYWHELEVRHNKRLGGYDPGVIKGESLL